jgi:hypothetical protein
MLLSNITFVYIGLKNTNKRVTDKEEIEIYSSSTSSVLLQIGSYHVQIVEKKKNNSYFPL